MKNKGFVIAGSVIVLLLILFFAGKYVIYRKIHSAITTEADSLRSKGFTVRFDSLETSSWSNSISVSNVDILFPGATCSDSASHLQLARLEVGGIQLLSFVFQKQIKVKSIRVLKPFFRDDGFHGSRNSALSSGRKAGGKEQKQKIKSIQIDHIQLTGAKFETVDSGNCRVNHRGSFTLDLTSLTIQHPLTNPEFIVGDALVTEGTVQFPFQFYTLSTKQIAYHNSDKSFRLDSLKLTPWYDKDTYVKKYGPQTDRIEASIPFIEIKNLTSFLSGSDTLHAERASLSFHAELYHDKRQPNGKRRERRLLSRSIHLLKLPLQIDSILVSDSYISYEEFPVKGASAGMVSFESLNAAIGNLSTYSAKDATLKAKTRFMNAGNLVADFTFPANPDKPYTITGSLTDFSMPVINRMLIPAANAEIKKGQLQSLLFNFEYNDYRSDGKLTMHYTDLDMISLLKNSKEEKSENKFVTLILKSFIVKKDMDQSKSTGTILFYRDTSKATFNYWWKSILSGIKSLYNLDKIVDTHHNKKK